ncbi:MAG: hypothetical protein DLM73_13380 [Chthoniobacterales bacterium]|nr:MAG: hypothetical protein DLM73_13380 [Chthoniobacterales bacterium]
MRKIFPRFIERCEKFDAEDATGDFDQRCRSCGCLGGRLFFLVSAERNRSEGQDRNQDLDEN